MAMCVHAAGESSPGNLPDGTYAIVLGAKDEAHLKDIVTRLVTNKVPRVLINEPDAPWDGSLMAIGVVPDFKNNLRRYLSDIPKYK